MISSRYYNHKLKQEHLLYLPTLCTREFNIGIESHYYLLQYVVCIIIDFGFGTRTTRLKIKRDWRQQIHKFKIWTFLIFRVSPVTEIFLLSLFSDCELESIQKSTTYLPTFHQFHTSEIKYQIADSSFLVIFFTKHGLQKKDPQNLCFVSVLRLPCILLQCIDIEIYIYLFLNFDFADEIAHRTKLASLF